MGFIPTGPLTVTSMIIVAVLFAVLWHRNEPGHRHIAVALLISWIAARTTTVLTAEGLISAPYATIGTGLVLSAVISYFGRSRASLAICALYAVRLLVLALVPLGLSWFMFWEANRIFLWIQFLIAGGEMIPGTGYKTKSRNSVSFFKTASRRSLNAAMIWVKS